MPVIYYELFEIKWPEANGNLYMLYFLSLSNFNIRNKTPPPTGCTKFEVAYLQMLMVKVQSTATDKNGYKLGTLNIFNFKHSMST